MRDYKKYEVWRNAHELTLLVYSKMLSGFPKSEEYDLKSQFKRATYSVPLNIVEGCGRNSDKDFSRFLDNALGSAQEAEYCGLLANSLGYILNENYMLLSEKQNEVKAKLINLIKTIRSTE